MDSRSEGSPVHADSDAGTEGPISAGTDYSRSHPLVVLAASVIALQAKLQKGLGYVVFPITAQLIAIGAESMLQLQAASAPPTWVKLLIFGVAFVGVFVNIAFITEPLTAPNGPLRGLVDNSPEDPIAANSAVQRDGVQQSTAEAHLPLLGARDSAQSTQMSSYHPPDNGQAVGIRVRPPTGATLETGTGTINVAATLPEAEFAIGMLSFDPSFATAVTPRICLAFVWVHAAGVAALAISSRTADEADSLLLLTVAANSISALHYWYLFTSLRTLLLNRNQLKRALLDSSRDIGGAVASSSPVAVASKSAALAAFIRADQVSVAEERFARLEAQLVQSQANRESQRRRAAAMFRRAVAPLAQSRGGSGTSASSAVGLVQRGARVQAFPESEVQVPVQPLGEISIDDTLRQLMVKMRSVRTMIRIVPFISFLMFSCAIAHMFVLRPDSLRGCQQTARYDRWEAVGNLKAVAIVVFTVGYSLLWASLAVVGVGTVMVQAYWFRSLRAADGPLSDPLFFIDHVHAARALELDDDAKLQRQVRARERMRESAPNTCMKGVASVMLCCARTELGCRSPLGRYLGFRPHSPGNNSLATVLMAQRHSSFVRLLTLVYISYFVLAMCIGAACAPDPLLEYHSSPAVVRAHEEAALRQTYYGLAALAVSVCLFLTARELHRALAWCTTTALSLPVASTSEEGSEIVPQSTSSGADGGIALVGHTETATAAVAELGAVSGSRGVGGIHVREMPVVAATGTSPQSQ